MSISQYPYYLSQTLRYVKFTKLNRHEVSHKNIGVWTKTNTNKKAATT